MNINNALCAALACSLEHRVAPGEKGVRDKENHVLRKF
jgi:hypothetical protein